MREPTIDEQLAILTHLKRIKELDDLLELAVNGISRHGIHKSPIAATVVRKWVMHEIDMLNNIMKAIAP